MRRPRRKGSPRAGRPGELPCRFEVFFDGCCEPTNPRGHVGWGCVILQRGQEVCALSGYQEASEKTSNNVAEYLAAGAALDWLLENGFASDSVILYGDSMLVINQMFGKWRIRGGPDDPEHREGLYAPLAREVKEKAKAFRSLHGFWIPRKDNGRADDLSKDELRRRGVEFRIQPEGEQAACRQST